MDITAIRNQIVTQTLEKTKQHQKGRVTQEVTNVTFNFTEGGLSMKLVSPKKRQYLSGKSEPNKKDKVTKVTLKNNRKY